MLCTTNKTLRHKLTTTDVEMIKKSQIHHATRCSGGRIALALSISANALLPVVWLMTPAFYFPYDVLPAVDLDDAGMIRIGDKRVTVFQPTGESHPAHRIVDAWISASVLPDNVTVARDLDRPVVVLVADEDVAILQKLRAVRIVQLIGPVARDTRGAVLPDDLLV